MVRLYADEGITGTSMKRRKEFLKMLRDCDRGKIDLIITKSVSRFGRNTLDGLDTVRKLKRKGIGVFFEKENTNTLYMDNEMILTFMMSQAQAESESLSGSVKWGHRKNFKDGKVYYHYASFLGYRKGPDGLPEIDPDEAAIVRRIFARYLLGQSVHQICRDLMSDGVKTAQGSDSWHDSVVRKMLQNEKYIGDALLQKTFMADLFTHEQRKNMGELPQYYVHECHPAIIDRDNSPSSPARAAVMLASSASFAVWVWNSSFMAAVTAAWMSVSFQVGDFLQIFFPCSRRLMQRQTIRLPSGRLHTTRR